MCRKLRDISKEEMIKIASTYANEKNATKKTIANDHNISVDMVSNVFIACFRQKLVDVATAINIAKKAIKNTSLYSGQEKTKKYYREMIFEMEIPAFLYNFGVIGFFLYCMPFLFIALYGVYVLIKKVKHVSVEYAMAVAGLCFAIAISFFQNSKEKAAMASGHSGFFLYSRGSGAGSFYRHNIVGGEELREIGVLSHALEIKQLAYGHKRISLRRELLQHPLQHIRRDLLDVVHENDPAVRRLRKDKIHRALYGFLARDFPVQIAFIELPVARIRIP